MEITLGKVSNATFKNTLYCHALMPHLKELGRLRFAFSKKFLDQLSKNKTWQSCFINGKVRALLYTEKLLTSRYLADFMIRTSVLNSVNNRLPFKIIDAKGTLGINYIFVTPSESRVRL